MSSIVTDTFLRTISIAYLMVFYKASILWLPIFYIILMVTTICIMKKTCDLKTCGFGWLYATISFACSAFEGFRKNGIPTHLKQGFKLRPISKIIYSIVLIGFSVHFGIMIAPGLLNNNTDQTFLNSEEATFLPQNCTNLCPRVYIMDYL